MVNNERDLDRLFRALGDRTRRGMLSQLAHRDQTVGELASPYRMSLAAASKHLKALERAGLIRRTIKGRVHYCRIDPKPLARADQWLRGYERLWDRRLAALQAMLRHPDDQ